MVEGVSLPHRRRQILRVRGAEAQLEPDSLAPEEPLEIWVSGVGRAPERVVVTMRSPGHDEELAVGFLRSEGLVWAADEIEGVRCEPLRSRVTVALRVPFDLGASTRSFVSTAACGLCGKAAIEHIERDAPQLNRGGPLSRSALVAMPAALSAAQASFASTGGAHAAGLFSLRGGPPLVREDVGRHNAVDKIVGRMVLDDRDGRGLVLLVSGRASFELVQKAAMAGVPFLCAISAPSSLAVEAAERLGVTLVGFLRGASFNIYAHAQHIDLSS
jgi:FdhD protein